MKATLLSLVREQGGGTRIEFGGNRGFIAYNGNTHTHTKLFPGPWGGYLYMCLLNHINSTQQLIHTHNLSSCNVNFAINTNVTPFFLHRRGEVVVRFICIS